ncbi:uncharacterized protein LOC126767376 [Bactrocera neohumeralis]|uniref:uncharacterized protein LOC126767376 n=1 Tax=Bactrocera neohumeralis TaxID=98809 RepID=UPI0021665BA4|nr:uncharacterized protein LOC126767376 [Bactrocera neohumeralis]
MEHVEDFSSEGSQDEQYYSSYEDLAVHRVMLADRPRMEFYRDILTDPTVVGGKVIVDIGSGSGILSAWAAMGGASHVISVEASTMADCQPLIFKENGIAHKVTVLHTTVEAMVEAGAAAFVAAHKSAFTERGFCEFFTEVNAFLGVSTSIELVPSSARLVAAPITLGPLYKRCFQSFWGNIDGVKMETLGRLAFDFTVNGASPLIEVIPAECLLVQKDSAAVLWERELGSLRCEELAELEGMAHYRLCAPEGEAADPHSDKGKRIAVDGFTLWFEVGHGSAVLSTAPTAASTHWKQTTILLPQQLREEGVLSLEAVGDETLDVRFSLRTAKPGSRLYTIEFELC